MFTFISKYLRYQKIYDDETSKVASILEVERNTWCLLHELEAFVLIKL